MTLTCDESQKFPNALPLGQKFQPLEEPGCWSGMPRKWATEEERIREINIGCCLNGIIRKDKQQNIVAIPITAGPSEFPKASFNEALQTMPDFNLLVDKLASSANFLKLIREELNGSDEFMNALFRVYDEVEASGHKCALVAGLNRNDFLFDRNASRLFQVEMNTFSCSFNACAQRVSELFRTFYLDAAVPENRSLCDTVEFIRFVVEQYGLHHKRKDAKLVLVIVQEGESNIFDQKLVEHELMKCNVPTVRRTFEQLHGCALAIDPNDGALLLNNEPVAAVYYRVGYVPDDYKSTEVNFVVLFGG